MERQPRKTRTKANALTSPTPQRVSLVKAGANQTPFESLKAEQVVVEQKDADAMVTSLKNDGYAISGFRFKGEAWTRAAVDAWMTGGGYSGYDVSGEDGAYVVKSDTASEGEAREIVTSEGVTISMVKAAPEVSEVAEGTEDEPSVQPVAAEKTDAPEAVPALIEAIRSAEPPEERLKGLYEVHSMAELIKGLKWLCSDLNYEIVYGAGDTSVDATRQEVIEQLKSAAQTLLSAFASLAQVEVAVMAEQFNAIKEDTMSQKTEEPAVEEPAVVDPAADPTPEPAVKSEDEPAAETVAEGEPVVEPAAEVEAVKSDAPDWAQALVASVTQITKSVETLTEQVKVVSEKQAATETATEEDTSVSVQSRKSADADEQAPESEGRSKEEQATENRMQSLRLKGALGL